MNSRINPALKRFNYIIGETSAIYHTAAQKMGLSDSAMHILYTVCCEDGRVYLSKIAQSNGISKQTINSAIRKLENDDIIYLEKGEGRNLYVCLTENGLNYVNSRILPIIDAESAVLASWSDKDISEFMRLNEKYRDELAARISAMPAIQEEK